MVKMSTIDEETFWAPNSPYTLVDTVCRFLLRNLSILATDRNNGIKEEISLPQSVSERFLSLYKDEGLELTNEFLDVICGKAKFSYGSVTLNDSEISDNGMQVLLRHKIKSLQLRNCKKLTIQTLHALNRNSHDLVRLDIGSGVNILPDYLHHNTIAFGGVGVSSMDSRYDSEDDDYEDESESGNYFQRQGHIIQAPNLKSLRVKDLHVKKGNNYFQLLLKPLPGLRRLELPGLNHHYCISNYDWLNNCINLVFLNLHDVEGVEKGVNELCRLKHLKHLDVSHCNENRGHFKEPMRFLEQLCLSLPLLDSLDISGTNLANMRTLECGIAGLSSRLTNPLNFLGLYNTLDACARDLIPARYNFIQEGGNIGLCISGNSTEEQILVAGRLYIDRVPLLEKVLNDLHRKVKEAELSLEDWKKALHLIITAMDRHTHEKHIQISGSASLFYVIKSDSHKAELNPKSDLTVMRNGCIILSIFRIPEDILFDYERLVRILLYTVKEQVEDDDSFVQRCGIFLLNSLACQVGGVQRELVGSLGAIEEMLNFISQRLSAGNMFPEKKHLLRNMLGLIGNVAEVPRLRTYLMNSEFVEEFSFLLDSSLDGIEVSYNAAGVVAHLASDGVRAWKIQTPDRNMVLNRMVRAIKRWPIHSKRNINYRSFEPIIRLLPVIHTPQCQLWAVWAIANLTKVCPEKYCSLVEEEGGLHLIKNILQNPHAIHLDTREDLLNFAVQVSNNVAAWKEKAAVQNSAVPTNSASP